MNLTLLDEEDRWELLLATTSGFITKRKLKVSIVIVDSRKLKLGIVKLDPGSITHAKFHDHIFNILVTDPG